MNYLILKKSKIFFSFFIVTIFFNIFLFCENDFKFYATANIYKNFNKTEICIYYQIFNKDLEFLKVDSLYIALCKFDLLIFDEKNNLVYEDSWNKKFAVKDSINMSDSSLFFADEYKLNFSKNGKYKIKLSANVNNNISSVWEKEIEINIFEENKLSMSGILFVYNIYETDKEGKFIRNNLYLPPYIKAEYDETMKNLFLYYEVYGLRSDSLFYKDISKNTITEKIEIYSVDGALEMTTDKRELAYNNSYLPVYTKINLESLSPGEHVIKVIITDNNSGLKEYELSKFKYNAKINIEDNFMQLTDEEIKMSELILKLDGNTKEIKIVKNLNRQGKNEYFKKYWIKKSKSGEKDKLRNYEFSKYFERYKKAVDIYGEKNLEIDHRANYYIKLGNADEKEKHYSDGGAYNDYEVWRYFRPIRLIIFYDENNNNIFKVIYDSVNPDYYPEKYLPLIEMYKK